MSVAKCKYCRNDGYGAMVTNAIWKEAKLTRGFVCIPCIEKFIKRKLKADDIVWCNLSHCDPFVEHLKCGK